MSRQRHQVTRTPSPFWLSNAVAWAPWLLLWSVFAINDANAACGSGVDLVPRGSVWRFLDTGANPPAGWTGSTFNDDDWPAGPAQLGYGEGDEATVVNFGPDPDNKYVTTYFRHSFVVTNAFEFTKLTLGVLRDDGVVVYLNGFEVFRNNMPLGFVTGRTLAATNVYGGGESAFYATDLGANLLFNGTNVLAAEVHQAGSDSPDLSFDLRLSASNVLTVTRGPYLQQGSPTGLVVRWRTQTDTDSLVRYGITAANLNLMATDTVVTNEHEIRLTGLAPNTVYYYSIGSSECPLAGGEDYFFLTSPARAKPTRIWVIGDAGTANDNQRAVRNAYYNFAGSRYTDLWLMLGDNAYGSGLDSEYQRAVFDMFPELLRKTVVWPTIGNHETYSGTFSDFPYLHIFSPPKEGEAGGLASGTKKYYSFDYGNIHFVCLDAMSSDRSSNGVMCAWLKQDLAANTNDWLIAYWHHPPYTKGSHDSDLEIELVEMRQNAVPILESFGVDLVLCGHSHCYERSYLLDGHYGYSDTLEIEMIKDFGNGRIEGDGAYTKSQPGPAPHRGTIYTVMGSSGQTSGGTLDHPVMYMSLNVLGSVVLDIDGNRLDAQFLRETGAIDDHYTILKGASWFRVNSVQFAGGILTMTWDSMPGKYYRVERSPDLLTPNWVIVSGGILATGTSSSWSDFIGGGPGAAYYRIVNYPD